MTIALKEDSKTWRDAENLILKDFLEHLRLFFRGKEIEVFLFTKEFTEKLPFQWGWVKFKDIIFFDSKDTYLLHFDLSD
ncbi:MAG: hypothetical protein AB8G22_26885 [Saprospiraceae bacterium]